MKRFGSAFVLLLFCFCSSFEVGATPLISSFKESVTSSSDPSLRMQRTRVKLPPWEEFLPSNLATFARANCTSWEHKQTSMRGVPLQAEEPPAKRNNQRRKVVARNLLQSSEGVPISPVKVPKSDTATTTFHFQPPANWMNDPNGPMYYNGYYHQFYQYNPQAAKWGNITWGHTVSTDLINWAYLPLAIQPGPDWYDAQGCWSGSATVVPGRGPIIAYTGHSNASAQVQCLAYPANLSDPYLTTWVKEPANPVLVTPPPGVTKDNFRDPSEAWLGTDGVWRFVIGVANGSTGGAQLYKSTNWTTWTISNELASHNGTGMWECVDFFAVAVNNQTGLPLGVLAGDQAGLTYVLKASLNDFRRDYYILGSYDPQREVFTPLNTLKDIVTGFDFVLDYGKYYASKSFYDPVKSRRVLLGWALEAGSQANDIARGWASVMAIPRTVTVDPATNGTSLLVYPIEELKTLRQSRVSLTNVTLASGDIVQVIGMTGSNLDLEYTFEKPVPGPEIVQLGTAQRNSGVTNENVCSPAGAARTGSVGPFGVSVLGAVGNQEYTAVYFEYVMGADGNWTTHFCADYLHSSTLATVDKQIDGGPLRVVETDTNLTLRIIVDMSIIESFAQGGRAAITTRVYPQVANDANSRVTVFNNGTMPIKLQQLDSYHIGGLSFKQLY